MRWEHWLYTLPLRLRSFFRRKDVEQELDDELRYHLARKIEEYMSQGLKPEEARYAAIRAMDGIEQQKEECRDLRHINWIDNLVQDLRFGVRMLAKTPGFTAAAVLTLALGIGANTAIFSVVNAVLLRPLPYPDPDRIVQLMLSSPEWAPGRNVDAINEPEFTIWSEERKAFKEVAAYDSGTGVNHTGNGPPEQLKAFHVSAAYFRLFGAPIEIGRTFSDEEDKPGGPRLVVLNNGFWRRRFGGDRGIVGKTLVLGGEPCVVIGILSAGFAQDPTAEIWLPLQVDPNSTNGGHTLKAAARLQPGVTIEMARAQMKPDNEQYLKRSAGWLHGHGEGFTAEPLRDAVVGNVRTALLVAVGAVSFVLLIACANVANLVLARATGRRREMAIRAALGGSRLRIVVQLLIESLALAFAGGALGLPLGYAGLHALLALNPGNIPRIGEHGSAVTLDSRVLAFTLLVSVSTGILFGLLPAFNASHTDLSTALSETSARTGASPRQIRSRSVLVIAEMALAIVLLSGAALLIGSLRALAAVDPGFDAHNVLTVEMSLNDSRFMTTAAVAQLVRDAERRVESLPGVTALAATYSLPLEHKFGLPFLIEGHPDDGYGADLCYVSRRYNEVFRIPLLRGRMFTDRDDSRAPAVVVINESLAQGLSRGFRWPGALLWRNGNPLGERITLGKDMGPPFEDRTRQIIGVVAEVRDDALSREATPMMYLPMAQLTEGISVLLNRHKPLFWAIRTRTEAPSLSADIQRELRTASGGLPVAHVRAMTEVVAESTARNRFNMVLLSIFAGVALVLAAIGIYGVMAHAVQQRTQEIGIRVALGARPSDVRRMVMREGMMLAFGGVLLGLLASIAVTPLMRSLLYGVRPSEPGILILVAVLLSVVALFAAYIPARRATRIDPVLTLRWE
jgi:putative ABC transport system permease protein